MRVLVTGATGTLGSALMTAFASQGHEPIALSRKPGSDRRVANVGTGEGLAAAVQGVDAIVHAASDPRNDPKLTDVEGTRRLAAFGIPLLYVSIVGVDRNPYKYYQVKRQGEQVLEAHDGPWTILRATQFHDFIDMMLALSRSIGKKIPGRNDSNAPVVFPKGWRFQPVSRHEVARHIVGLVAGEATQSIHEFAGPQVWNSTDLAATWAEVRGGRPLRVPSAGRVAKAFRDGAVLPQHGVPTGTVTWSDYLAGHDVD